MQLVPAPLHAPLKHLSRQPRIRTHPKGKVVKSKIRRNVKDLGGKPEQKPSRHGAELEIPGVISQTSPILGIHDEHRCRRKDELSQEHCAYSGVIRDGTPHRITIIRTQYEGRVDKSDNRRLILHPP